MLPGGGKDGGSKSDVDAAELLKEATSSSSSSTMDLAAEDRVAPTSTPRPTPAADAPPTPSSLSVLIFLMSGRRCSTRLLAISRFWRVISELMNL